MDFNRRILPFYMTYPGMEGREGNPIKDLEYFGQMYPERVKRYQGRVMEMLDRMDYEGSMIYDEYPDQLQIRLMCNRVCDKVKRHENIEDENLKDMVQLILFYEIYNRRCEYRKRRRKIYF